MKATVVKTAALDHRTGPRRGTAVREARIIPFAYSPAVTRMPRTARQIWESWVPKRTKTTVSISESSPSYVEPMVMPTARTRAAAVISVIQVERSVHSLCHSERRTREVVTR